MTDVWISNERHYCKYCNCWTSGDKGSIKHHETSWNHKNNIKKYLVDEQKKHKLAKKESDILQQEILKIQQAAHQSYQNDLSNAQNYYNSGSRPSSTSTATTSTTQPRKTIHPTTYDPQFIHKPTQAELESNLQNFYKSKGFLGTNRAVPPPPVPPPMPSALPSAIPLAQPKKEPQSEESKESTEEKPSLSGFKDFYAKFYQEFKKQPDTAPVIPPPPIPGQIPIPNPGVAASVQIPSAPVATVEEFDISQPYGDWEDVDEEEEAAKKAPVVLVEDTFTKQDPYFTKRHRNIDNFDSDDEAEDKEIKTLESKDISDNPLFSDDDEEISKPVVFKKRKRKSSKQPARKRKAISLSDNK